MKRELIFVHAGFGDRAVPYLAAWDLQRALHARRASGQIPDLCLMLEHPAVYTAGRRTSPSDRPIGDPGAPVIEVDRGGRITFHGPGQLVGYPVVALDEPVDVVSYVRSLEEALIRACAAAGLPATRVHGRSGVWVAGDTAAEAGGALANTAAGRKDRKVAAIGIRVARGVTMHGFALNCNNDLSWFDRIVPCGISDAAVTSLTAELGRPVPPAEVLGAVERELAAVLGADRITVLDDIAGLGLPAPAPHPVA